MDLYGNDFNAICFYIVHIYFSEKKEMSKTYTYEEALVYFAEAILRDDEAHVSHEDGQLVGRCRLFLWRDGLYHEEPEPTNTNTPRASDTDVVGKATET